MADLQTNLTTETHELTESLRLGSALRKKVESLSLTQAGDLKSTLVGLQKKTNEFKTHAIKTFGNNSLNNAIEEFEKIITVALTLEGKELSGKITEISKSMDDLAKTYKMVALTKLSNLKLTRNNIIYTKEVMELSNELNKTTSERDNLKTESDSLKKALNEAEINKTNAITKSNVLEKTNEEIIKEKIQLSREKTELTEKNKLLTEDVKNLETTSKLLQQGKLPPVEELRKLQAILEKAKALNLTSDELEKFLDKLSPNELTKLEQMTPSEGLEFLKKLGGNVPKHVKAAAVKEPMNLIKTFKEAPKVKILSYIGISIAAYDWLASKVNLGLSDAWSYLRGKKDNILSDEERTQPKTETNNTSTNGTPTQPTNVSNDTEAIFSEKLKSLEADIDKLIKKESLNPKDWKNPKICINEATRVLDALKDPKYREALIKQERYKFLEVLLP
ncbi:MAG: hypothetical protein LBE20_02080 [Deltaproteobacteria bacterium]|jgi:hypothetical protein|nr:hypothetical protein [Deltaproteobacteria bacterium]